MPLGHLQSRCAKFTRALTATKTGIPASGFAAHLCFCCRSSHSNTGSALCLMPVTGLHSWTLWLSKSSVSPCLSAELMSIMTLGAERTHHLTKLLPLAVGLLLCKPQQTPAHVPPFLCSTLGTEEYKSFP